MSRGAVFSDCRQFRYSLVRTWDCSLPRCCFIMLNPSTADETREDATTKRILRMATDWGYGAYEAVNLFAHRSSDPGTLRQCKDPIGPKNDAAILNAVSQSDLVVAAWGVHGTYRGRDRAVLQLLKGVTLTCLRQTKDGHPQHPLYLPAGLTPAPWPDNQGEPFVADHG